ncbi:MAG TPA: hypothetical protein VM468_02580 [Mycoplana sp.]|nr:hypothetical protein [Mycoplana sp.]
MLRPMVMAAALAAGTFLAGSASAQGLVLCADENGFCRLPYPTRVIYGVPGRSAERDVRGGGIPCSNQAFGDPAPGIPKRCAYVARGGRPAYGGGFEEPRFAEPPPYGMRGRHGPEGYDRRAEYGRPQRYDRPARWRMCASENEFCAFQGQMRVRYGAGGRFAEASFRNGVACSNSTFGDVAPGIRKVCQVLD